MNLHIFHVSSPHKSHRLEHSTKEGKWDEFDNNLTNDLSKFRLFYWTWKLQSGVTVTKALKFF